MKIKLTGLDVLMSQLRQISEDTTPKALMQSARASFKRVAETARTLAPVDSGNLKAAIGIGTAKLKNDSGVAAGIVISARSTASKQATMAAAAFGESQSKRLPPARRWHFTEFGTKNQTPKPFLRPALDQNARGVIDDLKDQMQKRINAAIKKKGR